MDRAATGQADGEGLVVGDAVGDALRDSGLEHLGRHLDDRAALKPAVRTPNGALEVRGADLEDDPRGVEGERVEVEMPPPPTEALEPEPMALGIVHEDADVLVVDKPAGMVVHPAPGNPDRTLVNALLAHCGSSLSGIGGVRRPGIVHRLDKDTSGVMVVAKDDATHRALSQLFARHDLRRIYQAPELFQLLATFALVLVFRDLALWVWGPEDLLGPRAPGFSGAVEILGQPFPQYELLLIAIGPLVFALLCVLLYATRWGILVRAATMDRAMLSALGVNIVNMSLVTTH